MNSQQNTPQMISRRVRVDRTPTPEQMLNATGCRLFVVRKSIMLNLPKGEGDEVEIVFFGLFHDVYTPQELDREYELRRLIPADPYSLAKVNQDDPLFSYLHPNTTHWNDAQGNCCRIAFLSDEGEKARVSVGTYGDYWCSGWWFAGIRK